MEQISLLFLGFVSNLDGDFLDSVNAELHSLAISLDDDLRVHTLLDE